MNFYITLNRLKANSNLKKIWNKEGSSELDFFLRKIFNLNLENYWKKITNNTKLKINLFLCFKIIYFCILKKINYPFEYIFQETTFLENNFYVNKNVFIPRVETEELVNIIIQENPQINKNYSILDIGTGSGVIAISLKKKIPQAKIVGIDISSSAIKIAQRNAIKIIGLQPSIKFIHKDIFDQAIDDNFKQLFDLIIMNPPYIATKEKIYRTTLKKEPPLALFAGQDGLDFFRKIQPLILHWLKKRAKLYLEMGYNQSEEILKIYHSLKKKRIIKDMHNKNRFFYGEKK